MSNLDNLKLYSNKKEKKILPWIVGIALIGGVALAIKATIPFLSEGNRFENNCRVISGGGKERPEVHLANKKGEVIYPSVDVYGLEGICDTDNKVAASGSILLPIKLQDPKLTGETYINESLVIPLHQIQNGESNKNEYSLGDLIGDINNSFKEQIHQLMNGIYSFFKK